jgi:hypothetical protein
MSSYFQFLYDFFHSFKLFHPTLFMAIYGYFQLLLVIFGYFILGYFWLLFKKIYFNLFHLRFFLVFVSFFLAIVNYFSLDYL